MIFKFKSYKFKFFPLWHRLAEPFVAIIDGLVSLILLPTKWHSNILSRLYRDIVYTQNKMKLAEIARKKKAIEDKHKLLFSILKKPDDVDSYEWYRRIRAAEQKEINEMYKEL